MEDSEDKIGGLMFDELIEIISYNNIQRKGFFSNSKNNKKPTGLKTPA